MHPKNPQILTNTHSLTSKTVSRYLEISNRYNNLSKMKKQLLPHVTGIPFGSIGYPTDQRMTKRLSLEYSSQCHHLASRGSQKLKNNKLDRMSKIAETLTQKLSLGAKILKVGGLEKIFRYNFSLMEGEKLLKASQCYISTTAGPIAGILFISTDRVAFCSEKSIELSSPTGEFIRIPYKVSIPMEMISRADESQNLKTPTRKYIAIFTRDNFEFWFMGFANCCRTLKYLQQVIIQT